MASKPESTFIRSIHKAFSPLRPYFEKNWNAYRGGTPDVYYSGLLGDLWVEYKYVPKLPQRTGLVLDLSELQKLWLTRRSKEGRHVAVILGVPAGGIIFDDLTWKEAHKLSPGELPNLVYGRAQVADWIVSHTGYEYTDA